MELNAQRSSNLSKRLFRAFCIAELRPPEVDEPEPHYTKTALAPVLRAEIEDLSGLHFQFRGDGGDAQALPASALEIPFYPDLALSLGKQHLWAAEVKLLRKSNRQNAIATALGQATLYRSRYEHVLVILIDAAPSSRQSQRDLSEAAQSMGCRIVLRPRVGKTLLTQMSH